MILKKLTEAKAKQVPDISLNPEEQVFADELREKSEKFKNLKNQAIRALRDIFLLEMKKEGQPDKISADDFINWFDENWEGFGDFIVDNYLKIPSTKRGNPGSGALTVETIKNLAEADPTLAKALIELAVEWKLVTPDEEHRDNLGKASNLGGMIDLLFTDACSTGIHKDYAKDAALDDIPNDDARDPELVKVLVNQLKKKLYLKEEAEIDSEAVEAAPEEKAPEQVEEPIETPEPAPVQPAMAQAAFAELVNNAIQKEWELISYISSIVTTIEYDYQNDNKEDVISVLNQIGDDSTINIGMLHKVLELLRVDSTNLLDAGEEKAEEIIGE